MSAQTTTYATVPTQFITAANGIRFAYRRLGPRQAIPIIYFGHLTANLDNCDPRIMDGTATKHEIISFDYRGVGASSGTDAKSIADMTKDGIAFIKALGYNKVDIMALSMGGAGSQNGIYQCSVRKTPSVVHPAQAAYRQTASGRAGAVERAALKNNIGH